MDRRLETFLAVCQTMNYRRAAEALHLTQPAVTKQIQSLEASYGVRLFSYDGRKLRKTAPGSALVVFAISQRYQEQELERALHAAPRKTLRVGATKTIGDYILPPAICSFVRAPEHELQFTVDNTTRLLGQLEAGQLDFVVVEGIFDKRRYDSFLLREEPYIGICAAGHRFAGRRVTPEELLGETLLLREPGSGTRSILERELMQVSYSTAAFSRTICISSFPVIRALTAANCGISFLYEAVVRGSPEIGSFTCPPLTGRHELNVVFLQIPAQAASPANSSRQSWSSSPDRPTEIPATSERSVQTADKTHKPIASVAALPERHAHLQIPTHSVDRTGSRICHCEEAAGRRGNLGEAPTISPVAFQ